MTQDTLTTPVAMQGDLEALATGLERTGDYRLLRRLRLRDRLAEDDGTPKKIGILLDTETTGLDPLKHEVIELSMLPFEFSPTDGRIFRILDSFSELREPSESIPAEITELTGITAEMVAGKAIDLAVVAAVIEPAAVIIAHKAGFDRRFVERAWPVFQHKAWACSVSEIDWRGEGFEGANLAYLLMRSGLFHDAHRGLDDCHALLEVLARPLPKSGELALKRLLDTARKTTYRIWAQNSPYDSKDALKERGYRWNDGSDGRPKAWWIDVLEGKQDTELAYLRAEIFQYDVELPITKLTAFDRFSERA